VQPSPDGLAQAFIIDENSSATIAWRLRSATTFYGALHRLSRNAAARDTGATVFGYQVRDPQRYGVEARQELASVSLEESRRSRSSLAVTGLNLRQPGGRHLTSLKPLRAATRNHRCQS
jgi:glucose-1-phosphate thymidylyltransferase